MSTKKKNKNTKVKKFNLKKLKCEDDKLCYYCHLFGKNLKRKTKKEILFVLKKIKLNYLLQ
jgi:hypothetical protein